MDLGVLTPGELMLASKAVGIHRQSMRRKLDRLEAGTAEHSWTLSEIRDADSLMTKLSTADLARVPTS